VNQVVLQYRHPEQVEGEICRAEELDHRRGLTSKLDEMWSYVGKKAEPRWLWHAIDHQQFPLIPLLPLFSSTQSTLWAVDISIEVKSSVNHAQNGFDMRSGIRLVRALNARSLSRTELVRVVTLTRRENHQGLRGIDGKDRGRLLQPYNRASSNCASPPIRSQKTALACAPTAGAYCRVDAKPLETRHNRVAASDPPETPASSAWQTPRRDAARHDRNCGRSCPLGFFRVLNVSFSIFHRARPPSHQLADVVLRHSKVRYPAEMLDFVLAHLPVLNEIHSHVGARLVEWHVIDKATLMCNACGAVMPLIRGQASLSLGHLHLLKQIRRSPALPPRMS